MKIAIVGSKPDTWNKVPTLDPEWEIWRFSRRNYTKPPNFHRWFEIHDPKHYARFENACPGYLDFINNDKRVILFNDFPFDQLIKEFGAYFFSGGQAPWMMAYAITFQPKILGLWGIDPVGDYKPQRSEVQHFVQVARDRGIEVIAPEDNVLQPRLLYARDTDTLSETIKKLGIDPERAKQLFANPPPPPKRKRGRPRKTERVSLAVT